MDDTPEPPLTAEEQAWLADLLREVGPDLDGA
jgi:hypothetical protein